MQDGGMIVAAIWNIKHGIELIIKGLGIKLDKKYFKHHNTSSLMEDLDNKISKVCTKRDLKKLKELVKKYYNCDFSTKTKFIDFQNLYFKYPEHDIGKKPVTLDYSFVHDLSRKDINQFLRDIHNLKKVASILESQFKHFINYKKLGINEKDIEKKLLYVSTMKNPYL
ncbi:hypothetical protein HN393_04500 [bacterium]|nr:hypothetical protein [bacterium]